MLKTNRRVASVAAGTAAGARRRLSVSAGVVEEAGRRAPGIWLSAHAIAGIVIIRSWRLLFAAQIIIIERRVGGYDTAGCWARRGGEDVDTVGQRVCVRVRAVAPLYEQRVAVDECC